MIRSLQAEQDLQMFTQELQLSKLHLEMYRWKQRSAILQLTLDSQQEDANHFQILHGAVVKQLEQYSKECSELKSQCLCLQVHSVLDFCDE